MHFLRLSGDHLGGKAKGPAQANTDKLSKTAGTPQAESDQPGKTGSGIGDLEEEHLPIEQTKDGNGHKEQKGEQKMSVNVISVNKGKGIDKGGKETLTTLNHKVSKLNLRGSYRKATDRFKRSRVASLFGMPKKEAGIREKRE
ncbi:hypothetical protein MFIFM68171_03091 [Madurella fahalii]|uniref:Uncharacterized protein n=1 Tax=Madurella fahalii TaxID=1157608 RepID=A0ABQ0G556_9PEZI